MRRFHFDDAHVGPVHVHDPVGGVCVLKDGTGSSAVRAITGDQLIEKSLCLAPLTPGIVTPASGERAQFFLNLLTTAHRGTLRPGGELVESKRPSKDYARPHKGRRAVDLVCGISSVAPNL